MNGTDEHRRLYPDQYTHALCGKTVRVETHTGFQGTGVVERVVNSRFGQLAHVPTVSAETWWSVGDCEGID